MNRTAMGLGALAAALVLFVAVNILAGTLHGARLDLTDGKLYTLSKGSRSIAGKIDEPITLTLYYSEQISTEFPEQKSYVTRVQEVLNELARAGSGKIKVKILNPEPYSDTEEAAQRAGLPGIPANRGTDRFYFGLVGENSTGMQQKIPIFDPMKEEFLEYDLTRVVYLLSNPQKKTIGVMAQLPVEGMQNYPLARGQNIPAWKFMDALHDYFDVRTIKPEEAVIPADVKVLLLIHPKTLTDKALYAIDQFVMNGGRLLIFVDPWCEADLPPGIPPQQAMTLPRNSDLKKLFDVWGIELTSGRFVGDIQRAFRQGQGEPAMLAYPRLLKPDFSAKDPVTADLEQIIMAMPGELRRKTGAAVQFDPIIESTSDSMLMDVNEVSFMADARRLLAQFKSDGQKRTIAARVSGSVTSAFPTGDPAQTAPEPGKPATPQAGHLAASRAPFEAIVVADCDLLTDRLWIQEQRLGNYSLGWQKFADNNDFVIAALDNLSGSSDLISIRARAKLARPFDRIQQIQRDADLQMVSKMDDLEKKKQEAEQKLRDLFSKVPPGTTRVTLSQEDQAERKRLESEAFAIKKQMRAIQFQKQQAVNAIGTRLKVIDVGLMPVLVGVAAVGLGAYRANRRRAWSRSLGARS